MIAGYCRVSGQKLKTDGQRRQDVDRQKEKIKSFCKSQGWQEPIFFCDDGVSAYKEDYNSRPEFCRMLREIRANRIQRVVVEDLTRWSRRIEDGLKTMREASEKCTVTSLSEGEIDTTSPEGWFKEAVAFLLAEWNSKCMSHKVLSGMEKRLTKKENICPSCNEIHLGRHPNTCMCNLCKKRKGRVKLSQEKEDNEGAVQG